MSEQLVDILARLKPEHAALVLKMVEPRSLLGANRHFADWAHEGQMTPPGDWRTWVIMAGRGFGKTRAGAEWVAARARADGDLRIALVAATMAEAREVMIDGRAGLISVAGDEIERWIPSRNLLRFTSGAEASLFSGASPEILRGPEHHIAWCDELAKWEKPGPTWDMLQLGMRLGEHPQVLVTTTPKSGPTLTRIMAATGCVVTRGKTRENPHLPAAYVETVEELYAGTRLGRQELDGELLPDVAGALWTLELIERCRVFPSSSGEGLGVGHVSQPRIMPTAPTPTPPLKGRGFFTKTVIGVDPPSGDGTCGIIACAIDASGIAYVLADHSVSACSPERWASAVAHAAAIHGAQIVVAETNQGGTMVESVLRAADAKLRVKAVQANMSKSERATPVAMRFESGKVKLCGRFEELEAELCGMIAGGGYEGPGRSPDRADAMVWALTELMLNKERAPPRISVF